ncbi:hypothetical protein HZH66_010328 [Vespula vulgaris]|uniref:Secreted protein n=1 Tax=Vespula vulgaris TaxID=7454 RepID=A0A834JPJ9_VESVU|nr:hypothetical protein HZH66_010328 [Vespula vulgaris]
MVFLVVTSGLFAVATGISQRTFIFNGVKAMEGGMVLVGRCLGETQRIVYCGCVVAPRWFPVCRQKPRDKERGYTLEKANTVSTHAKLKFQLQEEEEEEQEEEEGEKK